MSSIAKQPAAGEDIESPAVANQKIGSSTGRRAEQLALRIEEGAASLASFVEGVSQAEWCEIGRAHV